MSAGTGALPAAEELVERALRAAGGDRCLVLVEDGSSAELRYANNTTTTNGQRRDRRGSHHGDQRHVQPGDERFHRDFRGVYAHGHGGKRGGGNRVL